MKGKVIKIQAKKNYIIAVYTVVLFLVPLLTKAQPQLWGLSNLGGHNEAGTIFNTDSIGYNFTIKYNFTGTDGSEPLFTNLMQANDGMLYGLTYEGGQYNFGVLFQYNPTTLVYTKKLDFDSANNGSKPLGSLMQANNGFLYGMAYKGGLHNKGILFSYNTVTNTLTKQIDFDSATTGCYPHGTLLQANDGMLYGMTVQGGAYGFGVLFQYNPVTNVLIKKIDFDSATTGSNPLGTLMQASDGNLYGLTCNGGVYDKGVIFQYNIATSTCIKKVDFDGTNKGCNPLGYLVEANNGLLYGLTNRGGINDMGVLFEYDKTNQLFNKKIDFNDTTKGSYPCGSLTKSVDGNLYGMTNLGGSNGVGILFSYNPVNFSFIKKFDFIDSLGKTPFGSLIEICAAPIIKNQPTNITICTTGVAIFSVEAVGNNLSYQWQENGMNITNNSIFSGTNTATLTVSNLDSSKNGNQYICIIKGECANTAITNAAILSVKSQLNVSTSINNSIITALPNGANYQWVNCPDYNLATGTTTNQTYSVSLTGDYAVIVSANGCNADTSLCIYVDVSGIENYTTADTEIKIFPNPTTSIINVLTRQNINNGFIEIFDLLGNLIITTKKTTINISAFPSGVYFIKVNSVVKKIIKQ